MEIGQFTIIKRLAVGGMAEIFLARQKSVAGFQRDIVIKRILPELSDDPSFIESFLDEAKLAAHLQHRNIVQIYDLGVSGKSYFIAMEYVRGHDMSTLLKFTRSNHQYLPLDVAAALMRDVLSALDYAHGVKDHEGRPLGIVHRDVTPSNVIVTMDGDARVLDFGIAKATAKGEGRTKTGTVKGKLSYLAPEQVLGEPIDRRVDVFTASIVLYELLTNVNPFRGETDYASIKNVVELQPEPPDKRRPEISRELSAVVLKGLEKSAEKRYASCGQMLTDLENAAKASGLVLSQSTNRDFMTTHASALQALHEARQERDVVTGETSEGILDDAASHKRGRYRRPLVALAGALALALLAVTALRLLRTPPATTESTLVAAAPVNSPEPPKEPAAAPAAPLAVAPEQSAPHGKGKATRKTSKRAATDAGTEPGKPAIKSSAGDGDSGKVRFVVQPWANVEVDGHEIGATPMPAIELAAGAHVITLTNPELHRAVTKNIVVIPGQEVVVRAHFSN